MVERLHGSLAARAEAPAADRIQGIAFDLLDGGDSLPNLFAVALDLPNALHDPDQGAAAGAALGAHGGVPLLLARDDFVFRHEQGDELIGFSAAARQRSSGGGGEDAEEVSTVHFSSPSSVMACAEWMCSLGSIKIY